MEICHVVEVNVFPSKKKEEEEMNIHYYVTKPKCLK
jgi:hypothetical protein